MQASNDISTLYEQFEGDPGQYQEIGRSNHAAASRARWPLLAAIQPGQASVPPAVGAAAAPSAALFRDQSGAASAHADETAALPVADLPAPTAALAPEPVQPVLQPQAAPAPVPAAAAAAAPAPAEPAGAASAAPAPRSLQSLFSRLAQAPSSKSQQP